MSNTYKKGIWQFFYKEKPYKEIVCIHLTAHWMYCNYVEAWVLVRKCLILLA